MFSSLTLVSVLLFIWYSSCCHQESKDWRKSSAAADATVACFSHSMKNLVENRWRHLPGLRRVRLDEAFGHSKSLTVVSMVTRVAAIVPTTWAIWFPDTSYASTVKVPV